MGRPKVKMIDDSQPTEEVKKPQPKPARKAADSLVAQLQEELGMVEESKSQEEPKESEVKTEEKKVVKKAKTQKSEAQATKSKKYSEKVSELEKGLKPEDAEDTFTYKQKSYRLPEAIDMVKKLSYSKFDGTLEAHINTAQTGLRGLVSLPYAAGKKLRIVAFGKGAEESGADVSGSEETIETISGGKVDFDLVITTPEWMPKLAKVARILGPRSIMPNPKNGTITEDLKKAVESFQAGKTEYRTESRAPVMHIALGKLNQPNAELEANVKALLTTLGKSRVKKVILAPTMGASVKLDLASI